MPTNTAQLTPDAGRFIGLFVGDSGSGKTPAGATFCAEGKVLIEDFDGRIRGLLGCPWVDRTKVDYNAYPAVKLAMGTTPGTETVFSRLNKNFEIMQIQASMGQFPYKTIMLDSLTNEQWLLLKDALSLTHTPGKGRKIGALNMSDPNDYNFVSTAMQDVLTFLKGIPGINIIVTAHLVDKYEKTDPDSEYSASKVVGSKLALTDKLAASIPGGFDHVFEFNRWMANDTPKFRMRFWGDLARTTFPGMPYGWQDVTGKDFYKFMKECIEKGKGVQKV